MATAVAKRGMELSVEGLRKALAAVDAAVATRTTQPVLTNVLLSDGTVTGTDGEMRITAPLAGVTQDVLVPYHRLKSIVSSVTDAEAVALRIDETRCHIAAGGGRWTLPTANASDFPIAANVTAKPIARLPADQFSMLVRTVIAAPSRGDDRLAGVQVEFVDGTLYFVATDGKRLAVAEADIDQATDDAAALVPRRAMETLLKAASGCETVQLETTGRELVATLDETVVTARLLEGQFPKWQKLERDHETAPTLVMAGELLRGCSMAAVCASETSRGVRWTIGEKRLTLQAKSSEFGESVATCSLGEAGHACTFTINPAYAVDWLRSLDPAEGVSIEAKDAESAVLFRAGDCRITIMPLAGE